MQNYEKCQSLHQNMSSFICSKFNNLPFWSVFKHFSFFKVLKMCDFICCPESWSSGPSSNPMKPSSRFTNTSRPGRRSQAVAATSEPKRKTETRKSGIQTPIGSSWRRRTTCWCHSSQRSNTTTATKTQKWTDIRRFFSVHKQNPKFFRHYRWCFQIWSIWANVSNKNKDSFYPPEERNNSFWILMPSNESTSK